MSQLGPKNINIWMRKPHPFIAPRKKLLSVIKLPVLTNKTYIKQAADDEKFLLSIHPETVSLLENKQLSKGEKCVILAEVQFEARGLQCAEDKITSLTECLKCTMNNCESEEIVEAANISISNLLPTKSRSLYDIAYNRFKSGALEKCSSIQRECFVGILQ
ncbi:hypothetical protein NQ317_012205 [Molorchus minor]|uniref:Uncharacterized protein n=1 Tax=Molorchus minor TaxID=1323400 RepID=A0ABQ9JBF8_9CUCU|nr:hypothetical protein NQ317_012205 [Molorchus minor]